MMTTQSFGTWVQRRREALGLTREDLARAIGCASGLIREVETSRRFPASRILADLTSVLTEPESSRMARRQDEPIWNVPAQLTSFVGRAQELSDLTNLLQLADVRLVTLTGPGGSGKSRLALRAAEALRQQFSNGCCFVDLAPITAPQQVASAIAQALGIREPNKRLITESVIAFLRSRQLLLILDNYEHLLAAAALVSDILHAAPRVTVLVTSRMALQLYGEHEMPLAPLTLPDPHASLADSLASDAVQLFLSRSAAARAAGQIGEQDTAAIRAICRHLDGLPLAIELAAARATRFTPPALLERLERLGTLEVLDDGPRNVPARQQTIRATIAWSFDLLGADEQLLFTQLSVFTGCFDADAVGAVCSSTATATPAIESAELLERLHSQSLLRMVEGPAPGYLMLDTIRAFALERLREGNEEQRIRDRHLSYYLALAEEAEPQLCSCDQRFWLQRLEAAYPNLQAALEWSITGQGERSAGVRIIAALWYFWRSRGLFGDAAHWQDAPILDDPAIPALMRARALIGLAWVAERQGSYTHMFSLTHTALALAQQANDPPTLARAALLAAVEDRDLDEARSLRQTCLDLVAKLDDPWLRCQALRWFGRPAAQAPDAAWQQYWQTREQLATASCDKWLISELLMDRFAYAMATNNLIAMQRDLDAHELLARDMGSRQALALTYEGHARIAALDGRMAEALAYQKDRLRVERELDNDNGIGWAGLEIAWLQLQAGDFSAAEAALKDATAHLEAIDERIGMTWALCMRSLANLWRGDFGAAERDGLAALALGRTLGRRVDYTEWAGRALWCMGMVALAQGTLERAEAQFAEAAALIQQYDDQLKRRLDVEAGLALVAALRGQGADAMARMETLIGGYRALGSPGSLALGCWYQAPVLLAAGAVEAAKACCLEGLSLTRRYGVCPWSLRLLETLAACAVQRGQCEAAARWWGAAADLRERMGAAPWPLDRPTHEVLIAAARAALSAEGFAAHMAIGRSLGWEQMLDRPDALLRLALPATMVEDLAEELAMAAAIQSGLLPTSLPTPDGWQLAALLLPARETAGDFYDCITLADGRIGLLIADVAGKGLGPALYMATGRALIRTLVSDGHVDPADIMGCVNAYLLKETRADLFITAFYGVLDPQCGSLIYANAGHPPPLVISQHAAGQVRNLMPTGLVLGVELDVRWQQHSIQLHPGDTLVLYTDGVTEAQDVVGSFFETERLIETLRSDPDQSADGTVAGILAAVQAFAGSAPQADDITLLAATWQAQSYQRELQQNTIGL